MKRCAKLVAEREYIVGYRPIALGKLWVQFQANGRWCESEEAPTISPTHWLDGHLPETQQ